MGVSSGCFCFLSERLKADNEDGGRDIGGLSKRGESMTKSSRRGRVCIVG